MSRALPRHGLILDIQATQSRNYAERGISRYVGELTRALLAVPGAVRAVVMNPVLPFPGQLHPDVSCSPLLRWNTATELRRILDTPGPVAYHLMSPTELGPPVDTVIPPHVVDAGMPLVTTLYDIVPLLEPDTYLRSPQNRERYTVRMELYRAADLVLADSVSAREDAVRVLGLDPGRVVVVGGGASAFFRAAPAGDDPLPRLREALPGLRSEFVLSVAGTDARKNTERLIEAYASLHRGLRASLQLVVACRVDDDSAQRWRALAAARRMGADELVLTGHIADVVLRDLYRAARLMVFPSTHEGFGLPVAEAIACGCPVIAGDASAVPEVLDSPLASFDPRDVAAMSEAMRSALEDPGRIGALRDLGRRRRGWWTWAAVADRTLGAMRLLDDRAASPPATLRTPARLRVALVGRLDAANGRGAAITAVAASLGRRCRLTLYTDGDDGIALPDDVLRLPVGALERGGGGGQYDAVIYAVAGDAEDQPLLALARRFPGIAWLLALPQADTYRRDAVAEPPGPPPGGPVRRDPPRLPPPGERLAEQIVEMCGDRAPEPVLEALRHGSGLTAEDERRYGLLLTVEWAREARVLLLGDAEDERRLGLDQGPLAGPRIVVVVPVERGPDAVAERIAAVVRALAARPAAVPVGAVVAGDTAVPA